jgi:hypothetical protein
MFGLMKYYRCAAAPEDRERYRLHYCGVCKTLGKLYGQKARLLLNRDLVFLSELLTAMIGEPLSEPLREQSAFQKRSCFALPKSTEAIPLSFRIAAAYTVLVTGYKLDDNIADAGKGRSVVWRISRTALSGAFTKAEDQMIQWEIPVHEFGVWMQEQRTRERASVDRMAPEERLCYWAEPTAVTTGLSTQHAARLIGHPEHAGLLYELGYTFGQLIYLLDAVEDYERDARQGAFNAVKAAYRLTAWQIPKEQEESLKTLLRSREARMRELLAKLPIEAPARANFSHRLIRNLNRILGQEICPHIAGCDAAERAFLRMTLREKWCYAVNTSRRVAFRENARSLLAKSGGALTFALGLICILTLPQKALGQFVGNLNFGPESPDSSECIGIGMLLTLWLSVLAGMAAHKRRGASFGDCCLWCDCCGDPADCEGCDCDVCSGCDCGDCDCSGCDCGDCDCGGCDCG